MVKAAVVGKSDALPNRTNMVGPVASVSNKDYKKHKLADLVTASNIVPMLDKGQVDAIGSAVVEGYRNDLASRTEWTQRNADALKLAMQLAEVKNFPWPNCANVKFPLITIAALQFLSRVSILTAGKRPVMCSVIGADPKGEADAIAKRVGTHMSYQLTEEDPCWMDDDEKTKFSAALLGCSFKKSYFDPVSNLNVSEFVPASNFVVHYRTKNLEKAPRVTHLIPMTKNDIVSRERAGLFVEMDDTPPSPQTDTNMLKTASDEIAGVSEGSADDETEVPTADYNILEQHLWLDFDGDGYAEPYAAFVRLDTKQTLRIVARFFDEGDVVRKNDSLVRRLEKQAKEAQSREEKNRVEDKIAELKQAKDNHILRIVPVGCYTKFTFIPSPDGGFYDLGFGSLLGPLNESLNTIINQMLDSGTMNTTAGGFLGRGVKIKGGTTSFDPFEWKPVDTPGDDLRKNIFPLPVREPSQVMFTLLQLLITYGEKISGSTDIMTGVSPGQNTPAETSRNTIEQGMKIFSGIYARMHRGQTAEYRKLYILNRLYLKSTPQWDALTNGPGALIAPTDYQPENFRVGPSVDPKMVSESQRQTNSIMVMQTASAEPGFNRYLVVKEFLEAHNTPNIDMIYPDPKGPNAIPPAPNPKLEIEKQKLELEKQQMQIDQQMAVMQLQQDSLVNQAKILKLQAEATKLLAEAEGVDTGHQIALLNAQIGAAKAHEDSIHKALQILQKSIDQRQKAAEGAAGGGQARQIGSTAAGMAGMGSAPTDGAAAGAAAPGP